MPFLFSSKCSLMSLEAYSLIHGLCRIVSLNFQMLRDLPVIVLLLISSIISLWSENILCMALNLLKFVYGPECELFNEWSKFTFKKFCCCCPISINLVQLFIQVSNIFSDFPPIWLFSTERGVLKSPILIIDLSISSFSSLRKLNNKHMHTWQ